MQQKIRVFLEKLLSFLRHSFFIIILTEVKYYEQVRKKNNWVAYLFILPLMLLSFILIYYCIIRTVIVSFTDWNGMTDTMNFVGFKNYLKLLKDNTFWTAVVNNIIFFLGTVFVQAAVGFMIALLLKRKLPGSNAFKAIYFMPIAMATSITTAIFKIIMDPTNGALNNFLRAINLDVLAVSWLEIKDTHFYL